MERGILTAVGVVIALISLFFVAGGIGQLASADTEVPRDGSIMLVVVFGITFVAGAYLFWRMVRRRPGEAGPADLLIEEPPAPPTEAERELRILRFAETEHGRVTIPEVAASCNMTIAEAKATLERLAALEVATLQVTESGILVYVFPGFLSDADKARASEF